MDLGKKLHMSLDDLIKTQSAVQKKDKVRKSFDCARLTVAQGWVACVAFSLSSSWMIGPRCVGS